MSRFALLSVLVLAVAFMAWTRRSPSAKVADVKGGIGSLEGDRQVLAQMRKAGADLSKPTEVNFYLYFSSRDVADSAAVHARTTSMKAAVRLGASKSSWLCLVSGQMIPDEAAIRSEVVRLMALAKQYGGEYDGWKPPSRNRAKTTAPAV